MGIEQIIKEKREQILAIARKHGAYNIKIFGSVSRGEANANSDVDFLVEVGEGRTAFFPGGLVADLEELLGRKVDVITKEGLNKYIRKQVLKEAVPL